MKPLTDDQRRYLAWVADNEPRSSAVPEGDDFGAAMEIRRELIKAGLIYFAIKPNEKHPRQIATSHGRSLLAAAVGAA